MTTIRSAAVYAEELYTRGRGIPLWYPDPSETGEVVIGDVGFLHNGGFHRLFNVTVSEDHPLNNRGVPAEFTPLPVDTYLTDKRRSDLPISVLQSSSIRSVQTGGAIYAQAGQPAGAGIAVNYTLTARQGAILALKDYATRNVLLAPRTLEKYMKANLKHWQDFAAGLGLEDNEENILLVNGWTKTSAWHIAAFYEDSTSRAGAVETRAASICGAQIHVDIQNARSVTVEQRYYPDDNPLSFRAPTNVYINENNPGDQCVFLVAYRAKRRFIPFGSRIVAAAGYDQPPSPFQDTDDAGAVITATSLDLEGSPQPPEMQAGTFSFAGPCDIVLDYILKNSDAEIAITSETSIDSLFYGDPWPEDLAKYLDDYRPEIEVEDGVGTLSLKAAVRRARMHETQTPTQDIYDSDPKRQQSRGTSVEEGQLIVHGGSPQSKTLPWTHIVLRDFSQEMKTLTCMSVSRTGPLAAAGSEEGFIGVWNYKTGKLEHKTEEHDESVWAVAISHDGTKLASGGADRLGMVWRLDDFMKLSVLDGHDKDVVSIAWSPNGQFVVTGSFDSTARLWLPDTGEQVHVFEGHEAGVLIVGFSPDSSRVVTFAEAVGYIWDTASGARLHTLSGHESTVWSMTFSPQGDRIVTSSDDCTSRIWQTETGDELVIFHEHGGPVYSAAFSPDGKDIASGSFDETVVVCDSYSGDRLHLFNKHPAAVNTITYSHNGRFIASGSTEGHVKVWDTSTDELAAEFLGHEDKVKNIVFSQYDKDIVSFSDDGTIRVWNLRDALRFL